MYDNTSPIKLSPDQVFALADKLDFGDSKTKVIKEFTKLIGKFPVRALQTEPNKLPKNFPTHDVLNAVTLRLICTFIVLHEMGLFDEDLINLIEKEEAQIYDGPQLN